MASDGQTTLGVVVVGMGIAGKFRVRDLKVCQKYPAMENLRLVGYVSRRELDIEGAKQMSLEEALENPDVHIIIIATESNLHEDTARKAILAKKHVCVEFPMTLSADSTKDLIKLAEENGVVCYEEDVALLGPTCVEMKEQYKAKIDSGAKMTEALIELTGRYNGWVEDFARAGTPYMSSIDNIHNVLDLIGDLEPVESSIVCGDDEIVAEGKMLTVDGQIPLIVRAIRRRTIERRGKVFRAKFDDGTEMEVILSAPSRLDKGVYMTDLELFTETVKGTRDNTYGRWLTVRGLEIADKLNQLAKDNPKSVNYS